MKLHVDPESPVPLYHQIAEALRSAIEAGQLAAGDALEPMRQAAGSWGVNVHTVRHAYEALARDGLIERCRGPRGTRVLGGKSRRSRSAEDLAAFLVRVEREVQEGFGLSAPELAAALAPPGTPVHTERPIVYVVECSDGQSRSHANEIGRRFRVDARPWPLDRGQPPDGPVVSTYFHYNEIRTNWPRRLHEVRFLGVYPDPALAGGLARASHVIVCERDASTAAVVAADIVALLRDREVVVEPRVLEDPTRPPLESATGPPVLFAPRTWGELPRDAREHPRAMELRYVLDPGDLDRVGEALGWEREDGAPPGDVG